MRRIILAIIIIFLSWGSGFAYYLYLFQSYPINTSTITNAIVTLGTNTRKIEYGIALVKAGYAPVLFVTGVDPKTSLKNIILSKREVIPSQVIYGINNRVYYSDTEELADFIMTHNIQSIRLVTDDYEMPSAIKELTQLIPSTYSLNIVPHPIVSKDIQYKILFKSYNLYLKNMLWD
jgi:uncharacterized SAM-binding protein YcdF (DUF218 family)